MTDRVFSARSPDFAERKTIGANIEISNYAPIGFSPRNRRARRKTLSVSLISAGKRAADVSPRRRSTIGSRRSRPAARHHAEGPPRAHLLHHADENRAADVLIFTKPESAAAFSYQRFLENQLRAKYDFVGNAGPLHPAPPQAR